MTNRLQGHLQLATRYGGRKRRVTVAPTLNLQTLLAAEQKWNVPTCWAWRAMADVVLFIDYRGKTPEKPDSGVRLITARNVKRGFVNFLPEEFVTEDTYNKLMTRGIPEPGDVLFTTEAPMGNAAVVRLSKPFALAQRVINLHPFGDE